MPSLLQDRLFSTAALFCISREAWKHGTHTFSSIRLLGILGPGDRRLCVRLALHVHYRPFSVTSEESPRAPRDRRLHECVKLVHMLVLIYTHYQQ